MGLIPFALDRVGREVCKPDCDKLVDLLALDQVVELSGQHGLDEIFPIREYDPVPVLLVSSSRQNTSEYRTCICLMQCLIAQRSS